MNHMFGSTHMAEAHRRAHSKADSMSNSGCLRCGVCISEQAAQLWDTKFKASSESGLFLPGFYKNTILETCKLSLLTFSHQDGITHAITNHKMIHL